MNKCVAALWKGDTKPCKFYLQADICYESSIIIDHVVDLQLPFLAKNKHPKIGIYLHYSRTMITDEVVYKDNMPRAEQDAEEKHQPFWSCFRYWNVPEGYFFRRFY